MRMLANQVKAAMPAQPGSAKTKTQAEQSAPTYDEDFFKQLEMTDHASRLEDVLRDLTQRGFGVQVFSKAVTYAKRIHRDLEPQARLERVRNVYQRVKISFEAERQRRDNLETHIASAPDEATRQELRPSFEQCEQRLKGLNLVLLYYASGLKCIYEEREEASDHSEAQA
ncbi:uncharacterized protein LOC125757150 [Rhipicephalus sanguineus]|uniref:uncharacterized protein LOC125757150 n=1 Tax=Rhipicephalus sanguineus TaxID=34632 RepID=UPI0020C30705|nr:uncharacterized protein LOC125757150 [Rhipicephalus sanguineus]